MEGFFVTCLIISLKNIGERRPVSKTLQSIGIVMVFGGLVTTYIFTIIKVIILMAKTIRELWTKKKNKKLAKNQEQEYSTQRGLIFYTECKDLAQWHEDGLEIVPKIKQDETVEKPLFNISSQPDEEEEEKRAVDNDKEAKPKSSRNDPFDFLNLKSNQTNSKNWTKSFGVRDLRNRGLGWAGFYHILAQGLQRKSKEKENKKIPKKKKRDAKKSNPRHKNKHRPKRRRHGSSKKDILVEENDAS